MNRQIGTFNTIANGKVEIGGGKIDVSDYAAGDIIKAGTMVIFNGAGKEVTIVASSDTENLTKVNGLIWNDVLVPEGAVLATCAVVRKGRIYADRADIPASVEPQLPMIEFVREA